MDWFKRTFPANRIAAIAAFAGALAIALAGLGADLSTGDTTLDPLAKAVVAASGVFGMVATVLKFLSGSQLWDALQHGYVPTGFQPAPDPGVPGVLEEFRVGGDEEMGAEDEPIAPPGLRPGMGL